MTTQTHYGVLRAILSKEPDMNLVEWKQAISGNKSYEALLTQVLIDAGDNPQKYFKLCKTGYKIADAKTDAERELLLQHADGKVRALAEARAGLKSWPGHANRVRGILSQAAARGGMLGVPSKYHGAHTGRNSGSDNINLLNLPKQGPLAKIREVIIAPPGETLVIVDASQIEARGTAWIAGQDDLIERFARNEDPYIALASKIVGYNVRKPSKTDLPVIASRLKNARQLGKVGVLGAGYGLGKDRCLDYANGEPYKCNIGAEMAAKIIDTYRTENPKIVQFWRDVEKAFVYTAKYRRPCAMPRGLRFDSTEDCDLILTLPSGREFHYLQVRIVPDRHGNEKAAEVYNAVTHSWEYIWGGTITENIVQAFCRDILMEAILRLEDQGIHICFHCYDEAVASVPVDQAEHVRKVIERELSKTPVWASGLPLGAEGFISERYKKG